MQKWRNPGAGWLCWSDMCFGGEGRTARCIIVSVALLPPMECCQGSQHSSAHPLSFAAGKQQSRSRSRRLPQLSLNSEAVGEFVFQEGSIREEACKLWHVPDRLPIARRTGSWRLPWSCLAHEDVVRCDVQVQFCATQILTHKCWLHLSRQKEIEIVPSFQNV